MGCATGNNPASLDEFDIGWFQLIGFVQDLLKLRRDIPRHTVTFRVTTAAKAEKSKLGKHGTPETSGNAGYHLISFSVGPTS